MSRRKNSRRSGRRKRRESLFWNIIRIWGTFLLIALIITGVVGVRKIGIPVYRMYREAEAAVSQSGEGTFRTEQTTIIYDSKGKELKKLRGEKDVYYLEYNQIPDAAKLAIISIEDKSFPTHRGIDVFGVARSVISLVVHHGRPTMGGSTITQQLARNVFLNFEKTYSRKIKEMFIAILLEQRYTKKQILEYYLNNVYFANGFYGIEAASEGYFNKKAEDLSISQLAFLCAIPNSPARYDPYVDKKATVMRRNRILLQMRKDGYIDMDQYQRSMEEEISVQRKKETETNDYAATYIIKCATEKLMVSNGFTFKTHFSSAEEKKQYDKDYDDLYDSCRQSLYTAGYRIYTSIDVEKQNTLQESVKNVLGKYQNLNNRTDDGVFEVQGAAVCIDNENGKVVAIVGGREENQESYGLNRAYQSFRQPGSAIKPLLVYGPALDQGYTPDSIVDDSRMTGKDKVNNSGYRYRGSISLRKAVAVSSNVATYRLYQTLGPSKCLAYLEKMNFKGLEPSDYKYDTTSLGGFTTGVTVLEMAAGYGALANDGEYRRPDCILKITDAQGNTVVTEREDSSSIYSPNGAHMMTSVLESVVTDGEGTGRVCKFDGKDMPIACKTGTTTSNVDGWLCGYSPYYTTAVWVGRDLYKEVDNLKGNTYPAEIWKLFMETIHRNKKWKAFPTYSGQQPEVRDDTTEEYVDEDFDVDVDDDSIDVDITEEDEEIPESPDADLPEEEEDAGSEDGGEGEDQVDRDIP